MSTNYLIPETEQEARRVSLGATVRYRVHGDSEIRSVVLASPKDAALVRVSVRSPLAAGLLGHAEGSRVAVALPLGRSQLVDIVEVRPQR